MDPFSPLKGLSPPGLSIGTEVSLSPWAKKNLARVVNVKVGKGKGEGCGSADNGSGGSVLLIMATR